MLLPGLNANAVLVFNFFHYKGALKVCNIFEVAEYVQKELLVVFHVGWLYAQQVVKLSRDVVAFGHFWNAVD